MLPRDAGTIPGAGVAPDMAHASPSPLFLMHLILQRRTFLPQAPADLQEALPRFPGDCKAAADGLDIYKLSFTNDLYSPKTAAQRDASLLKVI